jgi:hypothetical protein
MYFEWPYYKLYNGKLYISTRHQGMVEAFPCDPPRPALCQCCRGRGVAQGQ